MSRRLTRKTRSRRAALSLELVLVLPIVAVVIFAVVEFSLLFSARQSLVTASRAGARVASLAGATTADVRDAVEGQLDECICALVAIDVELGRCSGDRVFVRLRLPMRDAAPDLLATFGLGMGSRELVAETVMSKE